MPIQPKASRNHDAYRNEADSARDGGLGQARHRSLAVPGTAISWAGNRTPYSFGHQLRDGRRRGRAVVAQHVDSKLGGEPRDTWVAHSLTLNRSSEALLAARGDFRDLASPAGSRTTAETSERNNLGVAILEPRPTIWKFNQLGRFDLFLTAA
ncbi:MAG: hypothetical protein ACLQU1_20030 [Bryobacteraceae bacterium]